MYYHCISMVESLRDPDLDPELREKYNRQLQKNRMRLSELADHSEVNYRMYQTIVVSLNTCPIKEIEYS